MTINNLEKSRATRSWMIGMIALVLSGCSSPAFAALGARAGSIQQDEERLQAKTTVSSTERYTVHELTSPLGVVVREYVSTSGSVFAVSWQGPFMPDLKQLLGTYFENFSVAAREHMNKNGTRSALNIQKPSLVFRNAGHMRAYVGIAYDPRFVPAGVNADDLR